MESRAARAPSASCANPENLKESDEDVPVVPPPHELSVASVTMQTPRIK
jgi:hypothetical protein